MDLIGGLFGNITLIGDLSGNNTSVGVLSGKETLIGGLSGKDAGVDVVAEQSPLKPSHIKLQSTQAFGVP